MTEEQTQKLLVAAMRAAATIAAIYQLVDRVNKAGGATSIDGVAACHAMLQSMNNQRARLNKTVLDPLNEIISEQVSERKKNGA